MTDLVPNGRWARILVATADAPVARAVLYRRSRSHRHSGNVERAKLFRAIGGLTRDGLLTKTRHGFLATDLGRDALRHTQELS